MTEPRPLNLDQLKLEWRGFCKGSHATFRDRYNAYLESPAWDQKRRAVVARAGGLCERCGGIGHAVHHLTYRRVFHEPLEDLILCCADCHSLLHDRASYDPADP